MNAKIRKAQILSAIRKEIENGRKAALDSINAAKQSMEESSKSSMGDKYETGRAMAQIEIENQGAQLRKYENHIAMLSQINPEHTSSEVRLGSLVTTDQGHYFVSIGMGKMTVEDNEYFVVSPSSPIGQVMIDKKVGDTVQFRAQSIRILNIY